MRVVKDISAAIIGLLPVGILWQAGFIQRSIPEYIFGSLASILLCLIIYHLYQRWHHAAVVTLGALGCPLMFYVFVAVDYPAFLPLFYGITLLVVLASGLGALVSGNWSWQGVGINLAFFSTLILFCFGVGSWFDMAYVEAGVLAILSFGITRLCGINILGWIFIAPRLIHQGMQKIWY